MFSRIVEMLSGGSAIPVIRNMDDFKFALTYAAAPSLMLLFGDIAGLPDLLSRARQHHKRLIVHIDLLEGIAKDRAGIKFLARMGVTAVITTRSQLVRFSREEGMIAIQRLFLMDSESIKVGIQLLRNCKPDLVEIMPAYTPARIIGSLVRESGVPAIAGGFLCSEEDVLQTMNNGVHAVSTSSRELWPACYKELSGF